MNGLNSFYWVFEKPKTVNCENMKSHISNEQKENIQFSAQDFGYYPSNIIESISSGFDATKNKSIW